ncbi:methyltransferase domain-containing protein [Shewanella cyperi]|uniref:Methyltransferase domain-containing protein n=1 Tax=Shewanella cyperi TaxID=2814292 RepID=A0A975AMR1_9GAMM|nr:methyltransferase domain-containing protein [Shewanella cyperi]QSX31578.1 methyltransferase domain-containing protein [Shewanella cyperi]
MSLSPAHWQQLPAQPMLQHAVERALSAWWPRVFGYHLLKLGPLSSHLDSRACTIAHQIRIHPGDNAGLVADYGQLPLKNACIDAVLMNMLLEFEPNPYQILRETDRVLISGGYLFIIGFNPLSTAFMGKLLPRYREQLPWCGHFFLPSRIRDWLGLLGYQVLADERFFYHPLIGSPDRFGFWQESLEAWLPGAGSLYMLVARKLDSPLTPIMEKRRVRQPKWSTATTAGRAGRVQEP